MGNPKLAAILRCTGLAILILGVFAVVPATAGAQVCDPSIPGDCLHGISIQKGCTPSSNCNDNADCSDNLFCNGNETCSTISATEPHEDCNIRVTNIDQLNDTITLRTACDQVDPVNAGPTDCTIFVSAVTDNPPLGDTTCVVNQVIGNDLATNNCVIGPGDVVTFKSNHYLIQATDPTPLPDQATIGNTDNCDGTPSTDCSTGLNNQQFSSQTALTNNCHPGTPPCPEDTNACTTITCNETTDACDVVTKTCPDDGNLCNGTPVCNTTTGNCDAGTPVTCTPDANLCDTESCDTTTGLCTVHTPIAPCADPTCTLCTPATGVCDPRDPLPPECVPSNVICRTPGFWGTHGGTEKLGSVNITQAVLNETGPLSICGATVSDTGQDITSAIEAICVSPKGDSTLQLARQLTAAALNCALTKSTGCVPPGGSPPGPGQTPLDVCSGVTTDSTSIADIFNACNAVCADPTSTQAEITNCIEALDCFNNGGAGLDAQGICAGDSGCHDRPLISGNGCLSFDPPGPAGSPRACNTDRKDCLTIFGGTIICP